MADTRSSQYWRSLFLDEQFLRKVPPGMDPNGYLLEQVTLDYDESKLRLEHQLETGAKWADKQGSRSTIYVDGFILLTYGRLDVIRDILSNLPEDHHPLHTFVSGIKVIIPIPRNLSVDEDTEAVLDWIQTHQQNLHWDESVGRFILFED